MALKDKNAITFRVSDELNKRLRTHLLLEELNGKKISRKVFLVELVERELDRLEEDRKGA